MDNSIKPLRINKAKKMVMRPEFQSRTHKPKSQYKRKDKNNKHKVKNYGY